MILKLMRPSDMQDGEPFAPCRIIESINEAHYEVRDNGEAALHVQYGSTNRGLDSETFILCANAYLMNDGGKTIQTFSPTAFRHPDA